MKKKATKTMKPAAKPKPIAKAKAAAKAKPTASAAKATSRKKAPKLLAGGNPQIAKGDGEAPVRAYIAAIQGWKQDVTRRVDAIVAQHVPQAKKAVKWNSPFYGIEGQGWFLSLHVFTKYVKLTFFKGTSLSPIPPGGSKHPEVRYLDLHEGELNEAELSKWVKQAAKIPGWIP